MCDDYVSQSHDECEFCLELENPAESRFGKVYRSVVSSRVVAQVGGYIAVPTIGQLLKGSLLVFPITHFETMAESLAGFAGAPEDLTELLSGLELAMAPLGYPLLAEHGAKHSTGAGCGVYHAHLHLIPMPSQVQTDSFLPVESDAASSLLDALGRLRNSDHYMLVRDTGGTVRFAEAGREQNEVFTSQFVRRRLAELFGIERAWNWKEYDTAEPWLLETIAWFGKDHVSVG